MIQPDKLVVTIGEISAYNRKYIHMYSITERPAKLVVPVAEKRIRDKSQAGEAITRHQPHLLTIESQVKRTLAECERTLKHRNSAITMTSHNG